MYMPHTTEQAQELERLCDECERAFDRTFPAYCMGTVDLAITELKRCLAAGEPSKVKPEPGARY